MKEARSSTADIPHSPTISAQDLLDYLRRYNILLIDVRSYDMCTCRLAEAVEAVVSISLKLAQGPPQIDCADRLAATILTATLTAPGNVLS